MASCKTCGKKFHACHNCGLLYDWEYHYCNEKCFEDSYEYKTALTKLRALIFPMNRAQRVLFLEALTNNWFNDYEFKILEILEGGK